MSDGVKRLDDVNAAMSDNIAIAGKVKTLVDEVNLGSQEQARGMEQIAKAVNQMEQVTQRTAASAQQSASTSQELTSLAGSMQEAIGRLEQEVGEGGGNREARSPQFFPPPAGAPGPRPQARPPARKAALAPPRPRREEIPLESALSDFREIT
ncbi:MAG: hypothetical protein NTY38_02460 [Acidobacteria bacterium]|nr:hypothetical protein [Acidobacteriota bacterium]